MHRARSTTRAGVTFLETVFAVTLLAMVATTMVGVSAALRANTERQRQILGAAEMANRLMVIQADDEDLMPQEGLPVAYGDELYRWMIRTGPVGARFSEASRQREEVGNETVSFDRRLRHVEVTVWLSEESGGSFEPQAGVPTAVVSRIVDPIAFDNFDRDQRRIERGGINDVMETMIQLSTGGSGDFEPVTIGGSQLPAGGG